MHFRKIPVALWLLFGFALLVSMPLSAREEAAQPEAVIAQEDGEVTVQQLQKLVKMENAKTRRKIAALQTELIQMKMEMQQPGFTDIIGGIGYIAGIFGLAFYLAARKKTHPKDKQND